MFAVEIALLNNVRIIEPSELVREVVSHLFVTRPQ
jgi:hypothetical protein